VTVLFSKKIIAPMSVDTPCTLELVTVTSASRKVSSAGFWFVCSGMTLTRVKHTQKKALGPADGS